MINNKNGFTLIELLSVIVIFAITFLIVVPTMNSLIGSNERREIELIEERVLSAAKEYVNNFDGSFYKNFYKEGDTGYVYKSDLINAGLIDENEISKLNTFAGVKGELLSNERIRYTVEYINATNNEYTNEELYLMMQNIIKSVDDNSKDIQNNTNKINSMNNGSSGTNTEVIEDLQNQINTNSNSILNLTNKDNTNNLFLKMYPVGSIYVTNESTNPGSIFGGTWVVFGAGRTLVGVDNTQTEFASVGLTGGAKTHTLTIDEMPSHEHGPLHINGMKLTVWSGTEYGTGQVFNMSSLYEANGGNINSFFSGFSGNSQPHNNLQPYITVYMWKRTA